MNDSKLITRRLQTVSGVVLCILTSCTGPCPVPLGDWQSTLGRADIRFVEKDSGDYSAIVSHPISGGGICPIEYPLLRTPNGFYIQAEGRILVSFDPDRDRLFLSPGGTYIRKANDRKDLPEATHKGGHL